MSAFEVKKRGGAPWVSLFRSAQPRSLPYRSLGLAIPACPSSALRSAEHGV